MDQKDNRDNGFEDDDDLINDAIDADFADEIDADVSGDDDIDFIDEAEEAETRGGAKFKKLLLPALVLVIAAGAGGYVVLNPHIAGGGKKAPVVSEAVQGTETTAGFEPAAPVSDITETAQAGQQQAGEEPPFFEGLPQPAASMNETPRPPEMPFPDSSNAEEIAVAETAMEEREETALPPSAGEPSVDPFAVPLEPPPSAQEDTHDDTGASSPVETAEDMSASLPMAAAESSAVPPETPVGSPEENSGSIADDGGVSETTQVETVTDSADSEPPEMPFAPQAPVMPSGGKVQAAEEAPENPQKVADSADGFPSVSETGLEMAETNPPQEAALDSAFSAPSAVAPVTAPSSAPAPMPSSGTVAPAADTFYDGRIATGPMAGVGPRKADPTLEPASQFVVVKKAHEASDMESLLVSANRALKLGRYESALDMFDQLYEKNSRDRRILMGRAVAQQYAGLSESAIRSYEEILDIDPDNAEAMLNMLGLLKQQYPSVALRRLIDLQQKHPNNAGIAAQIGLTYADMGQNDEAVRYLQRAASQEPQNAQHIFNLAILSDRLGDTRNAVSYYEKALELDAVYSSGRSLPREVIYNRLADLRRR